MVDWIVQHAAVLQALVGLVTAAIWITYLHVFVASLHRQRRSEILITMGGSRGLSGRVLVSNLGLEPIYVLDVMLRHCGSGGDPIVSIADRTEVDPAEHTSSDRATLQRPLKSGEHVEIGTINDMLERVARHLGRDRDDAGLSRIEITVAAVTAAASSIVAARRVFEIRREGGRVMLRPTTLYARQIRGIRGRRRIERQLLEML